MTLLSFFTENTISDITERIDLFVNSDNKNFKYSIVEKHIGLSIDFSKQDDSGTELNFRIITSNDGNILNPFHLEIEITKSFLDIFIPNVGLTKINFSISEIGSHTPKASLIIISEIDIESNLDLTNCKFEKIQLFGSFNNLTIQNINTNRLTIKGIIKVLYICNVTSKRSNSSHRGFIEIINGSDIENVDLHDCKGLKNIDLTDSSFSRVNLSRNDVETLNCKSCNLTNLLIEDNSIVHLKIIDILPIELARISIWDNKITTFFAERVDFGYAKRKFSFIRRKTFHLTLLFKDNKVEEFVFNKIRWSYKAIIAPVDDIEEKKEILLKIKQYYNKNQDIPNEKIFKSFEKIWYYKNGEIKSMPLILSYISNKFGLSLLRPFLWIISLILLEILIFYLASNDECKQTLLDNFSVITYLINPAHSTNIFIELFKNCNYSIWFNNIVVAIDNIFRIFIGYLIFQFIDAFRYKYNLSR